VILVSSTIPAYKLDRPEWCTAWLLHAEAMAEQTPDDLRFLAILEVDARGLERFTPLLERLFAIGGDYWTFSIDTGVSSITSSERIPRICLARNLMIDYMLADRAFTHLLFLDADTEVPPDSIQRLLELDHPVTAGHVPTYCLDGPKVPDVHSRGCDWRLPDMRAIDANGEPAHRACTCGGRDVRQHWSTAGFLLVRRDVLGSGRWGWNPDLGLTDDPWTETQWERMWGSTWTAHDVVGQHHPPAIPPVEHRGHDLSVYR